ncbi:type IV pilus secretin PilQ family protein [Halomonas sp. ML-15]|uniref:type IV pilus secretin PilQ family protein n=1 Tax=Halomonas sp. ML-15 TaxID=2773305 RepID=UPI0017476CE9|nr:type IV pilus secretin PilQ family protein [Halomonas sp. ML-15]MBD3894581.1 type IV pilus secretin PilQ family protein [Halomonas sp. ML-15]
MTIIGRLTTVLILALLSLPALAASTLDDLSYRQGASGELEVVLGFSGGVPEVRGYRLDEPARLTIDLMETSSRLERSRQSLQIAGVRDLTTLEAGSRTRLVFALDSALPYNTRQEGDSLVLSIGGEGGAQQASAAQAEPAATAPAASREPRIEEIDFRRGDGGAGRLIVTFDRAGVDSRVRESGNRIIAELRRVELPTELDQVLDVTDFGTPLRRISPQPGRDGVTLELEASGDFAMLSTHSGRELVIEVQPVSQAERETRERERFAYTGERITLNFQDIEVRSVLAIIADVSGLNLVASDSVTGNVTLNLQEVPWDQALDLVLKSHGLSSRQEGNVIVVAPASELANIERQEIESREQMETLSPLTTEMIQVRYARASDLAALLRGDGGFGLLTDRGRVSVDQRTNTLLIQDTADQIQSIMRTLDQLDVAVRQVQIEARIVIARDSATRELGVRWGASSGGGGRLDLAGASDGTAANGGLVVDMGSGTNPLTTFAFGYLSGDILLDLELRALESEGKSQTISQPRVITANQRTAVIKQGTEIPYQEATSSGATNVEFKEAVLSLEVTPQITPDNRIIMDLVINNDTVGEEFAGVPSIDTNQIETQVLVDNGETVVLGGILTTEQVRSLFKTPFFGDLPLIGNLFRYTQDSSEKVELLVFITPRIIEDGLAIR